MHKLPKHTFNQLKIICDMWLYSLSPCPPSSLKELNVWTVKLKVHIFLNKPKSSLKLDSFKWISQTWASSFSHKPSLNFICSAWLDTYTSICKHLIGLKVMVVKANLKYLQLCRNSTTMFLCTWHGRQLQASSHSVKKHLQIFQLPSTEQQDLRKKIILRKQMRKLYLVENHIPHINLSSHFPVLILDWDGCSKKYNSFY